MQHEVSQNIKACAAGVVREGAEAEKPQPRERAGRRGRGSGRRRHGGPGAGRGTGAERATINTPRKATGGLSDHQALFDPHILRYEP